MKSNLIKGMIFISAISLSSCSSTNKLASMKNAANDDDVYYTHAKAGDVQQYFADNGQLNAYSNNGDDDYFYYGSYASRLRHFNEYSPIDYNDDFYYSYIPYNNGFGAGTGYDLDYYSNYTRVNKADTVRNDTTANYYLPSIGYIYSPFDFGYSRYNYCLYDDFGCGGIYAAYILGGGGYGGGGGLYNNPLKNSIIAGTTNPNARGIRTTPSPGVTRIGASLPGKPTFTVNTTAGTVTRVGNVNTNAFASRQTRDLNSQPQQQSVSRPASTSSVSSGSSSSGAGGGGGGGGRPGRP